MKQLRYVAAFSLIVALTGLSSVMAADAGRTSDGDAKQAINPKHTTSRVMKKLTHIQMDNIHGGYLGDGGWEDAHISGAYNAALASGANMMKFHVCYLYGC